MTCGKCTIQGLRCVVVKILIMEIYQKQPAVNWQAYRKEGGNLFSGG